MHPRKISDVQRNFKKNPRQVLELKKNLLEDFIKIFIVQKIIPASSWQKTLRVDLRSDGLRAGSPRPSTRHNVVDKQAEE